MSGTFRGLTGGHPAPDLRMGIQSTPGNVPNSWTPHPDEYQLFAAERTKFSMNRQWDQIMLSSNMRTFDFSNVLPQNGPISGGVTLTHRLLPRYGPQLQFGEDCEGLRPRCPTCVELDNTSFGGMAAIYNLQKERREIMVEHLRRRVQHCGSQAAAADKMAYDWHSEGNKAFLVMHHFNMAHIEASRRERQQPPIGTPPTGRQERRDTPDMTGRSVTYKRGSGEIQEAQQPSSTDGNPPAKNKQTAVTLSKVAAANQNGVSYAAAEQQAVTVSRVGGNQQIGGPLIGAFPAEDGARRSYKAAVQGEKRQAATYTYIGNKTTRGTADQDFRTVPNAEVLNRAILATIPDLPLQNFDDDREHQLTYGNSIETPTPRFSSISGDSQPGTPAQGLLAPSCHGTYQEVTIGEETDFPPEHHMSRLQRQREETDEAENNEKQSD